MNIKTENKLKLNSLINHREKILTTEYPYSYLAQKKSILKILNDLIVERAGWCKADLAQDYTAINKELKQARV